jgi:uncharacterized membrane protein SirB2
MLAPLTANAFLSAGLLVVCGIFLVETNKLSYPSNVFPYLLVAVIALFAVVILGQAVIAKRRGYCGERVRIGNPGRVAMIVVTSLIYVAVVEEIGYYVTTGIYLLLLAFVLPPKEMPARKKAFNAVMLAMLVVLLIFGVFDVALQVPTPKGMFF